MRELRDFLSLYRRRDRRRLAMAVIMAVGVATFDFASLLFLYPILGSLSGQAGTLPQLPVFGSIEASTLIFVAMGLMICRSALSYLTRFWWFRRAASAEVGLGARLMTAYAFAPYSFHLQRNSAELLARAISHVNMATVAGLNGLVLVAADLASVIAMSAALFVADPQAAAAVFGYLSVLGALFTLWSKRLVGGHSRVFGQEVTSLYSAATTVLRGIRELTVAGGREVALTSITQSRTRMARAQQRMQALAELPKLILEVAMYTAVMAALLFAVQQGGRDSLAVIALYVVAGLKILPSIARALTGMTQIRTGVDLGRQVREELQIIEAQALAQHREAGPLPETGALELRDVEFGYDSDRVFSKVSLKVEHGEMIGIVGPSGSGKSTLLGILLGLLPATEGEVEYGGVPVGIGDPSWLARVAFVPQDVFILDDTLLANVALGDPQPDPQRAKAALKAAHLAEVVDDLPSGLETGLSEGGSRFSAGQRQRLGIARALYREAKVMLLDEPTASLDEGTEGQVTETLVDLRGEVTMIIVAHRLRTLERADRVYRLSAGSLELARG